MINTINGILEAAKGGKTGVIAVAAAHDQPVIEAVVEARKEGIATPILVGHVDEIKDMLSGLGENPAEYEIVAGDSDDLIISGVLTQTGQHVLDLVHMAHQNGGGDALLTGLHHRLDHGLVMCGGHGYNAGLTALGGL